MTAEEMLKSDDAEIVQLYSKIYLETHSLEELDKELQNTDYDIYSIEPLIIVKSIQKLMAKYQREMVENYLILGFVVYGEDKTDGEI